MESQTHDCNADDVDDECLAVDDDVDDDVDDVGNSDDGSDTCHSFVQDPGAH